MRISLLAVAVLAAMAGCSQDSNNVGQTGAHIARSAASPIHRAHPASSIAAMPDRGDFVKYDGRTPPVVHGAYTSYPVQLSEARALRAVVEGSMVIDAPDGHPIRLQYTSHVTHPDGNWTWIGHPEGASPGTEAVLTFGDKAVFGSIPNGKGEALELTTQGGRTWMVSTDQSKLPSPYATAGNGFVTDEIPSPVSAMAGPKTAAPLTSASAPSHMMAAATHAPSTQAATAVPVATVDLVLGYTTGFATRYGGPSQALTRLTFMVDIANQAYTNSQVHGRLRLVHAVQVNYRDDTQNRGALYELSGVQCATSATAGQLHLPDRDVNCTPATAPASLQPLLQARERYGADLVSLVRTYHQVANETCGVAWLLGGGQSAIDASSAPFAMSVVSDSGGTEFPDNGNTCRDETLAHELGHNMGLAHDQAVAQGADDTNSDGNPLDPEEYGRFPYSFGYKTGAGAGNFYTIMAVPNAGQAAFRVFSNPRITSCGGLACGTSQSDNALTLEQTMPIIANFRVARVPTDFNGDGVSDILWRNFSTGADAIWRSGNFSTPQAVTAVTNLSFKVMKGGDFDGDGAADILWHNVRTGANAIWRSGHSSTPLAVASVTNLQWNIVGVGDFNGDGRSDILWRNSATGANAIWKSGDASTPMPVSAVANTSFIVAGVGDFDNDGFDDIVWRNKTTGANAIWRRANSGLPMALTAVTNTQWLVAGVGDFNADGYADILWHNASTGTNVIWKSANSSTPQAVVTVTNPAWAIVGIGDFNGDGFSDMVWRNSTNGANAIWLSGNFNTQQAMTAVTGTAWKIVP